METAVDTCTDLFTSRSTEISAKLVNLGDWLQYYAFDIVGELTFAKKFGFLTQGIDVDGTIKMIELFLIYASRCGQVPEMHPLLLGNPLLRHFLVNTLS
jgi:hypothetical protein